VGTGDWTERKKVMTSPVAVLGLMETAQTTKGYNSLLVIPVHRRQRQKDGKFEANFSYIIRPCPHQKMNKRIF
jgi:hypothetical protein